MRSRVHSFERVAEGLDGFEQALGAALAFTECLERGG
jgi:hypothetical protein